MTHFASGNLGRLQAEGLSLAGEGRVCWVEKMGTGINPCAREESTFENSQPRRPLRCQRHLVKSVVKVEGIGVGR